MWMIAPILICAMAVIVALLPSAEPLEARDEPEETAHAGTWVLVVATLAVLAVVASALRTIV